MTNENNTVVDFMDNTGTIVQFRDHTNIETGEEEGIGIFATLSDGRRWAVSADTVNHVVHVGVKGTPDIPNALSSLGLDQLVELEAAITCARKELQAAARPSEDEVEEMLMQAFAALGLTHDDEDAVA